MRTDYQCDASTRDGYRCARPKAPGADGLCHQHYAVERRKEERRLRRSRTEAVEARIQYRSFEAAFMAGFEDCGRRHVPKWQESAQYADAHVQYIRRRAREVYRDHFKEADDKLSSIGR